MSPNVCCAFLVCVLKSLRRLWQLLTMLHLICENWKHADCMRANTYLADITNSRLHNLCHCQPHFLDEKGVASESWTAVSGHTFFMHTIPDDKRTGERQGMSNLDITRYFYSEHCHGTHLDSNTHKHSHAMYIVTGGLLGIGCSSLLFMYMCGMRLALGSARIMGPCEASHGGRSTDWTHSRSTV